MTLFFTRGRAVLIRNLNVCGPSGVSYRLRLLPIADNRNMLQERRIWSGRVTLVFTEDNFDAVKAGRV